MSPELIRLVSDFSSLVHPTHDTFPVACSPFTLLCTVTCFHRTFAFACSIAVALLFAFAVLCSRRFIHVPFVLSVSLCRLWVRFATGNWSGRNEEKKEEVYFRLYYRTPVPTARRIPNLCILPDHPVPES